MGAGIGWQSILQVICEVMGARGSVGIPLVLVLFVERIDKVGMRVRVVMKAPSDWSLRVRLFLF